MIDKPRSETKYSAPTLIRYGDMAKLTASGSGSVLETNPTGQPMKHT